MWITTEQLGPLLKQHWFTTNCTESSVNYVFYNNRSNVKVYTLRFNLGSQNYSDETMLEDLLSKVMNQFPETESLIGTIQYDMLLMSTREDAPSYYLWRANSNHRSASRTEETFLNKEYHQLYFFGQKAINADISELSLQFESSDVVVADILTIVFTFTSM